MVEHDHRVILGEGGNVIGEVLLRPSEPVYEHEPRAGSGHLDREPDPIIRRDAHTPSSRTTAAGRQTRPPGRAWSALPLGSAGCARDRSPQLLRAGAVGRPT
jgi:hypothetical protein